MPNCDDILIILASDRFASNHNIVHTELVTCLDEGGGPSGSSVAVLCNANSSASCLLLFWATG